MASPAATLEWSIFFVIAGVKVHIAGFSTEWICLQDLSKRDVLQDLRKVTSEK